VSAVDKHANYASSLSLSEMLLVNIQRPSRRTSAGSAVIRMAGLAPTMHCLEEDPGGRCTSKEAVTVSSGRKASQQAWAKHAVIIMGFPISGRTSCRIQEGLSLVGIQIDGMCPVSSAGFPLRSPMEL
jgi:hypothetical protein